MGNRFRDWFRQAEADLQLARTAAATKAYEWACFAAQQSAEKALKAVFLSRGVEAWGHTLTTLVGELPEALEAPPGLADLARMLDKHYIPTRYPDGFDSGAPTDFYTAGEATLAIQHAEEILAFCRHAIG